MKGLTHKQINDWRVFPRIIMIFVGYMWHTFNDYFFAIPVQDHTQWALVQYATVTATFIGFAKFYMDSGNKTNDKFNTG